MAEAGRCWVAEGERSYGVAHDCDGLMFGHGLHPAGQGVHPDVGAGHEDDGVGEHRKALRGLGISRDETDADEHPQEREAAHEAQSEGEECLADRAV